MKEIRVSKKLKLKIRRIVIAGVSYTIRPSFAMPYMTGFVEDVEKPLFLRKFAVPFWALSNCFGKNPMYWYRLEATIGRYSLVGTTIKSPEKLPRHLSADEKHTRLLGKKTYIATTVGNNCILGASVSETASSKDLQKAYGVFKEEAECINPEYQPDTVNTDGWRSTRNAWKKLFPKIAVLSCFLHIFIGICDRSLKKHKEHFLDANLSIRAWALIQNFAPLNPWTVKQKGHVSSFERINGFRYHENWLQNLLISGSLGGLRTGPKNPL